MLGLIGVVIGLGFTVLTIYHWDLIDTAFVNLLTKAGGGC